LEVKSEMGKWISLPVEFKGIWIIVFLYLLIEIFV
jgi:hypothetical protein